MNSFSCVITGHRPTRFKFKYNEKDKRCQRIKKCLQEQLIRLYNQEMCIRDRCKRLCEKLGIGITAESSEHGTAISLSFHINCLIHEVQS